MDFHKRVWCSETYYTEFWTKVLLFVYKIYDRKDQGMQKGPISLCLVVVTYKDWDYICISFKQIGKIRKNVDLFDLI